MLCRWLKFLFILFPGLCVSVSGFSQQSEVSAKQEEDILIVYLSRTQNTRAIAEMIHQQVGGHLIGLELVTPYPDDYQTVRDQVKRENERNYLPTLKTVIQDFSQYSTVFIGFPTWGMQLPPPMKSFLNQYDLSAKVVIPFNTHAGYGVGDGFNQIREGCRECDLREGLSLKGGAERDGILLGIKGDRIDEVTQQVKKWLSAVR